MCGGGGEGVGARDGQKERLRKEREGRDIGGAGRREERKEERNREKGETVICDGIKGDATLRVSMEEAAGEL